MCTADKNSWHAAAVAVTLLLASCHSVSRPGPTSAPPPATPPAAGGDPKIKPYEVLGRRYVPLTASAGYRERGVASWYGPNFHGKPTANGEIFDMHAMTAAHKTLPLPTYVEVTNLRNGRRVTVRVNDRGPFVDNRLIDLSQAAAAELDMVGPGTSLVDVRVVDNAGANYRPLDGPPASPPPGQPATRDDTIAKEFYIQVGAFAVAENAERVRRDLEFKGLAGVRTQTIARGGQNLYRVRVGPIVNVEQFDSTIGRLGEMGYNESRLAVD